MKIQLCTRSKCQKHIIGQSTNINVFSDFYLSSNWERESGKRNLGIKEKCPQSYLFYFRRGSTGEFFFFHGLIDFVLFLVLAWGTRVSHVSVILLSSTLSKMAMVRLPRALLKNWLLVRYFRWGEGSPTSVLGSQPIIWLLSLSPSDVRRPEVTKCEHLVSPAWPTFLPNGHLFDGWILLTQREDSISLTSIVSVGHHVTLYILS